MRSPTAIAILCGALFTAHLSHAQVPAKTRSAARALGAEGIKLFEEKAYEAALDRFNRADELLPTPTLGVRAARCLVELGRYVEASERFLAVTRTKLGPNAHYSHALALRDAKKEREAILPKIGKLTVFVEGPRGDGVAVTLNGMPLANVLIDVGGPIDPGTYEVVVSRADTQVKDRVSVAEGGQVSLTVKLPAVPPPPPPSPPPPAPGLNPWEVVAVATGATGVGFLLSGVGNGLAALALQSDLEERCPNRMCAPDAHGAADRFDAARALTTIGLVAGVVGIAGGVTLWFTSDTLHEGGSTALVVGPTSVNMTVRF